MQAKELIERVTALALPICSEVGVTLWDVTFEKEGAQYMLTVTIDREGGVDIDHCETVSRAIDPLLDGKAFASLPAYTLCVSSAGLARKLKKPEHFAQFIGHDIVLRFYRSIDGAKQVTGCLKAYDAGYVTLSADGAERIYEPADIADVSLDVKF